MGSTESKAFTGMPIPGAAGVVATLIIFYYEIWETVPDKNLFILLLTIFLSILMVSTLRFHGAKELNLARRKPFSILVAIVMIFTLVVVHPQIALFLFAMTYLIGGIIENIILYYRKRRQISKTGATQ
jgi:CDP-diacylglycerol--serine O-phosphatidyltransferase